MSLCFFFNDTATTEIYTLSLHDALPICSISFCAHAIEQRDLFVVSDALRDPMFRDNPSVTGDPHIRDRKSTRLNSSHANISYAVFCLKKKTNQPSLSSSTAQTLTPVIPL